MTFPTQSPYQKVRKSKEKKFFFSNMDNPRNWIPCFWKGCDIMLREKIWRKKDVLCERARCHPLKTLASNKKNEKTKTKAPVASTDCSSRVCNHWGATRCSSPHSSLRVQEVQHRKKQFNVSIKVNIIESKPNVPIQQSMANSSLFWYWSLASN